MTISAFRFGWKSCEYTHHSSAAHSSAAHPSAAHPSATHSGMAIGRVGCADGK
ncbi:MAG: hypothetical protein L3K24_00625 [Gammaproteobacteria bacterium]|nr:hypothetical protein [Gammaproteobacteria bacterium]